MDWKLQFVKKAEKLEKNTDLELAEKADDVVDGSSLCNPCSNNKKDTLAVYWCIECNESFCSKCASHHKLYKALKDHHVVDLSEKATLQFLRCWFETSCMKHPGRQVEYLCKDHEKICCNDCIANKHGKCSNTITLELASKGTLSSKLLNSCSGKLDTMLEHINNLSKKGLPDKDYLKTVGQNIETEIYQRKKEMIESINKREQELLVQLKKFINEGTLTINNNSRSLLQTKMEVEKNKTSLAYFFNNASNKQIFVNIGNLRNHLMLLEQGIISLTEQFRNFTISFEEISYRDLLGKVDYKIDKKSNFSWTSCNFDTWGHELDQDIKKVNKHRKDSFSPERSVSNYKSTTKCLSFNLHNELKFSDRLITGIAVTPEERILLCDSTKGSNKVLTYDKNGQFLKEIQMAFTPWNITIIPNSKTAVVTFGEQFIQFADIHSLTPGRQVNVSANERVFGVAATTEEILVGGEGTMYILDVNGSFESKMILAGGLIYYIHVGGLNRYYYSDLQNVYCIKPDGTLLFSYSIKQSSPFCGIETDRWENVYIIEHKTNQIKKLDPDGFAHGTVLGTSNGIYMPLAMRFSIHHDLFYVSVQGNGKSKDPKKILCFKCLEC